MFVAVLNWMLAHTPGFLKPAVSWLVEGLRRLTAVVASRWNALGTAAGKALAAVTALRRAAVALALAVRLVLVWLVTIYVPQRVAALTASLAKVIDLTVAALAQWAKARLADLGRVLSAGLALLSAALAALRSWATAAVNGVTAVLAALLRGVAPVLLGPAYLAEWLLTALLGALGRYLMAQRDRLLTAVLHGSPAMTSWLARILEDMIVRLIS